MPDFSITSPDFKEGGEIPKKCGYKHGNQEPELNIDSVPPGTRGVAIIIDDPDAMKAVGKVWVHYLCYRDWEYGTEGGDENSIMILGKTDFDEIGYGGPAPPDGRHTYIFKAYALDTVELELEEGYSKQELEDAMKGHILAEAKLTGTFAP